MRKAICFISKQKIWTSSARSSWHFCEADCRRNAIGRFGVFWLFGHPALNTAARFRADIAWQTKRINIKFMEFHEKSIWRHQDGSNLHEIWSEIIQMQATPQTRWYVLYFWPTRKFLEQCKPAKPLFTWPWRRVRHTSMRNQRLQTIQKITEPVNFLELGFSRTQKLYSGLTKTHC